VIALAASGISKSYGGFNALSNVQLNVRQGEIRGLIGPNGAGKSTLIDALSGRDGRHSGRVELFGRDITELTPAQRRALGLSRSFQRTSIFPKLSVRRQIELAARAVGSSDTDEIMEEFGLLPWADSVAADIGYGDQRRLDLALAMTGQPKVLLLDEPAAGLSFEESKRLAQHLRAMATRRAVTVVLVEHDMDVVFSIADSITVLQVGTVLAEGEPQTVRANPAVIEAYLGSAG
jgi:branched-chain amino acid transport system ATP-binding protein